MIDLEYLGTHFFYYDGTLFVRLPEKYNAMCLQDSYKKNLDGNYNLVHEVGEICQFEPNIKVFPVERVVGSGY